MPNIHFRNINLYYETYGSGPALMLIAGLASDSQSWQPIIKDISKHFLVIAPDNRGTGRTSPMETEGSIQQIADDYFELINHLGLSTISILGHSMGGFIAMDFTLRFPDKVDKLILAGTASSNSERNNYLFSDWASDMENGMDPKEWFRNIFYWIFTQKFFKSEKNVTEALNFAINYPYPQSIIAFRNQVEAIVNYKPASDLSKITSKTLVINGKEDILFPVEAGAELAGKIPASIISGIDNAAHSIHVAQPEAFTHNVLKFLLSPDREL
ncbi:MAG: alpha/beta hydrolase [Bacteroidales bacterium]|nr:alpha/beta hydrolase [Bacteroidales bacterium]